MGKEAAVQPVKRVYIALGETRIARIARRARRRARAKLFYEMENVGKARYTVNMHDGVQTHRDGSPFYGIALFRSKRAKDAFVRELKRQGYAEK